MMTYLLFGTALGLSAVAAYYSIMGLVAIFAAAATPIFIMGSLLEASKLVVASWLYRSWKKIPKLMMMYFTTALVVLMMLTSMGIFGYLSKAHLDQAVPTGDVASKLSLIDEKIKTEKDMFAAELILVLLAYLFDCFLFSFCLFSIPDREFWLSWL